MPVKTKKDGEKLFFTFDVLEADKPRDVSGRIFTRECLEQAIEKWQPNIEARKAFGTIGPVGGRLKMEKVAFVVADLRLEEDGVVRCTSEVLDTPDGRALRRQLERTLPAYDEAGCKYEIRAGLDGYGSVKDGVVQDDFAATNVSFDVAPLPILRADGTPNPFRMQEMEQAAREHLRETFATLEHDQWAHWTQCMLDSLRDDIVASFPFCRAHERSGGSYSEDFEKLDCVLRWREQIDTDYVDLSEEEKDSDRAWADRALWRVDEYLKVRKGVREVAKPSPPAMQRAFSMGCSVEPPPPPKNVEAWIAQPTPAEVEELEDKLQRKSLRLDFVDALAAYCENDECEYQGMIDDPDPECDCRWCTATRLVRSTPGYPDHRRPR